ncbi:ammonium transporter, partial [Nannochloropsis oceanica]
PPSLPPPLPPSLPQEHKNNAPHIPFIILGTSLLWFGWFGFNSGSALAANGVAMQSLLNTNCAASAAMITWLMVDKVRGLKPTVTGACVGAVVGLVTITPACGFVDVGGSFVIGITGALLCNMCCVFIKNSAYVDDQLEVFPAHGVPEHSKHGSEEEDDDDENGL